MRNIEHEALKELTADAEQIFKDTFRAGGYNKLQHSIQAKAAELADNFTNPADMRLHLTLKLSISSASKDQELPLAQYDVVTKTGLGQDSGLVPLFWNSYVIHGQKLWSPTNRCPACWAVWVKQIDDTCPECDVRLDNNPVTKSSYYEDAVEEQSRKKERE